jgi:hypothetical protein
VERTGNSLCTENFGDPLIRRELGDSARFSIMAEQTASFLIGAAGIPNRMMSEANVHKSVHNRHENGPRRNLRGHFSGSGDSVTPQQLSRVVDMLVSPMANGGDLCIARILGLQRSDREDITLQQEACRRFRDTITVAPWRLTTTLRPSCYADSRPPLAVRNSLTCAGWPGT